jgi:hypothetical protein
MESLQQVEQCRVCLRQVKPRLRVLGCGVVVVCPYCLSLWRAAAEPRAALPNLPAAAPAPRPAR